MKHITIEENIIAKIGCTTSKRDLLHSCINWKDPNLDKLRELHLLNYKLEVLEARKEALTSTKFIPCMEVYGIEIKEY